MRCDEVCVGVLHAASESESPRESPVSSCLCPACALRVCVRPMHAAPKAVDTRRCVSKLSKGCVSRCGGGCDINSFPLRFIFVLFSCVSLDATPSSRAHFALNDSALHQAFHVTFVRCWFDGAKGWCHGFGTHSCAAQAKRAVAALALVTICRPVRSHS